MDNLYYIKESGLNNFLNSLSKSYNVFSPILKDQDQTQTKRDYFYKQLTDSEPFVFNAYRTVEPLKVFFTPLKENIAEYFHQDKTVVSLEKKTTIFGIKACDIAAHKIQDFVFLEGVECDSLYRIKRENTIFISGDCTDFKDVCHCLAWEILPYPTEGFDLNLSPQEQGYIIEVGSEKGEGLIQEYKEYFILAEEAQISARNIKRQNLIERLKRHLFPQNLVSKDIVQRLVKEGYNLDTWQEFMLNCVECGGCNFICDTCHCFLLTDERKEEQNVKLKVWDSCQYANFARVAGGANSLKSRTQRLRNRFLKKFDFFVENLGIPACCGCGRCIEVCPGKIDIREVLKDLAKKIKG